jgi:hypothetical protein
MHSAESEDLSRVSIYHSETVKLLVTDPFGRRTGLWDPSTFSYLKEIENSNYLDEGVGSGTAMFLYIWGEPAGRFTVTTTGLVTGEFDVGINTNDANGGSSVDKSFIGTTRAGRTYTYTVDFSPEAGIKSTILPATYAFGGFRPPLVDGAVKTFRKGKPIPIRFTLKRRDGKRADDVGARLFLIRATDDKHLEDPVGIFFQIETGMRDAVVARPAGEHVGNRFRYDRTKRWYAYDLSTDYLDTGIWHLLIQLDDGSVETARFELK